MISIPIKTTKAKTKKKRVLDGVWTVEKEGEGLVMIDPVIDRENLLKLMAENRRKEERPKEIEWFNLSKLPELGEEVVTYMVISQGPGYKYGKFVTDSSIFQGHPWSEKGNAVLYWAKRY